MADTQWLDDLFAGVMVAIALYSASRLVAARLWARPTHRDVDVAHVLMGASMAGQLVSELNPIPNGVWELVFVALSAWFAWKCYEFVKRPGLDDRIHHHVHRLSRRVIHLMMALAMLYMYLAATPARIGTGMAMGTATGTTADFVFIPLLFIMAFAVSAVWQMDSLGRFGPTGGSPAEESPLPTPIGDRPLPARRPDRSDRSPQAVAEPRRARKEPAGSDLTGPDARWLAPRLEAGAHIVMAVTMAYMLVLML